MCLLGQTTQERNHVSGEWEATGEGSGIQHGRGPNGEWIAHAVNTMTSVFVSPDEKERYYYFYLEVYPGGGVEPIKILFNAGLTVGIIGDMVTMLKTIFGVNMSTHEIPDIEIDWAGMPPPPDNPEDRGPEPPDRHEEN